MRAWLRNVLGLGPRERFAFRASPTPLVDGELELVEPAARWVEPMLMAANAPTHAADPTRETTTRHELMGFLAAHPRGHWRANPARGTVNAYTFWMSLRDGGPVAMGGSVSLRLGDDENLRCYLGHVGYGVHPPARGRHLAERSVRLLLPLARAHGLRELWITANPDNRASRRTCERLGGELHGEVDLPPLHPLALRGETRKCRYRIDLG